ncbi:MAG: hypothetical protein ACRD1R_11705 [Acidobacteriota bacterium]
MNRKEVEFEELLPIQLKLRLLQAELDKLESDVRCLDERCQEVQKEIRYYEKLLFKTRHRQYLHPVK